MTIDRSIRQLGALAHESRLDLFRRLVKAGHEGIAAGALADAAGLNFTTASAQLASLANARLVVSRRAGRSVIYTADYPAIRALIAFLMEDCCQGRRDILDPLADAIADIPSCEPIQIGDVT